MQDGIIYTKNELTHINPKKMLRKNGLTTGFLVVKFIVVLSELYTTLISEVRTQQFRRTKNNFFRRNNQQRAGEHFRFQDNITYVAKISIAGCRRVHAMLVVRFLD